MASVAPQKARILIGQGEKKILLIGVGKINKSILKTLMKEPFNLVAVHRDVDTAVAEIAGVKLLNIDDIQEDISHNLLARKAEAVKAERIIDEEVKLFCLPAAGGRKIRVGTRGSRLALAQVEEVSRLFGEMEIIPLDTAGDLDKQTPIDQVEGTDFFTDALDRALLKGEIDLAVHSAKDLPDKIPDGLIIVGVTPSIDPSDVLVSRGGFKLNELAAGARVGTSSKRRKEQLLTLRPDLIIEDLRGNIDERLGKLDAGELDAVVIAAAALMRLGLADRIAERLPFEAAKGQGSLALVARENDEELKGWLQEKLIQLVHYPYY